MDNVKGMCPSISIIFYVREHTFIYAISDLSFAHIWAFIAYISLHLFPLL